MMQAILLTSCKFSTPTLFTTMEEKPTSDPCTDPYFTTVIDGVTYSGSTATANEAYISGGEDIKRILYDESLDEEARWRKVKNIQENMNRYAKFRCLCKTNCESKPMFRNGEEITKP